jgi:hypothetical protein
MRAQFVRVIAATPILGLLTLFIGSTRAGDLRLESVSLPAPFLNGDKTNLVLEASGVEPIGDGHRFLVAHDKAPALHVVDIATGRLIGMALTSSRFPAQTTTGPKWEGMARDVEGNFYIVGSHSGKTDAEKAEKSFLLRFRLKDGSGDTPAIDDASVVRWEISRALPAALKTAGVDEAGVAKRKIEGLAVRDRKSADGLTRRELAVGLREPGDKVRAFVADITDARPDSELALQPLFSFDAGAREGVAAQLGSLEYVPALNGFLVATLTEDANNAFHGNALWFVADGVTDRAEKVATFEVAMKCEGLAVLDSETRGPETRVKLLITFDNDPHTTKIPSRYQTATLVREAR